MIYYLQNAFTVKYDPLFLDKIAHEMKFVSIHFIWIHYFQVWKQVLGSNFSHFLELQVIYRKFVIIYIRFRTTPFRKIFSFPNIQTCRNFAGILKRLTSVSYHYEYCRQNMNHLLNILRIDGTTFQSLACITLKACINVERKCVLNTSKRSPGSF